MRTAMVALAVYFVGLPVLLLLIAAVLVFGLVAAVMFLGGFSGLAAWALGTGADLSGALSALAIGAFAFVALAVVGDGLVSLLRRLRRGRRRDARFLAFA